MPKSRLSYAFLLSFIAGVFCLQWAMGLSRCPSAWIVLVCLSPLALLSGTKRPIAVAALLGLAAALGSVAWATRPPSGSDVSRLATKQSVTLLGIIVDEPDRREKMTSYIVRAIRVRTQSGTTVPVTGPVLIRDTKRVERLVYGDLVLAAGTLRTPWSTPAFDYDRYLSLRNIHTVMTAVRSVERADGGRGNAFFALLYGVKERFEAQIEQLLPEPHAAFLEGLLTGSRRGIPGDLMDDFNATGLTHIIAISGTNITIILSVIGGLLFWLPLRHRLLPSLLALFSFTLFTGASASVVRAAIMGTLGLLALRFGRRTEPRLTILWAMAIMLAWQPRYLWWDAGFQLSFLAVIGLVEAAPLLQRICARLPEALGIRESMEMTLAAQCFTTPWILWLFGRLSLIAPVANLLVAPLVPLAMLMGFLAVMGGFLWPSLGRLLAFPAWGVLQLIVVIVRALARFPFASLPASLSLPWLIGIYAILIGFVYWFARQQTKKNHSTPPALPSITTDTPILSSPASPTARPSIVPACAGGTRSSGR